jgi:hypothetical protein
VEYYFSHQGFTAALKPSIHTAIDDLPDDEDEDVTTRLKMKMKYEDEHEDEHGDELPRGSIKASVVPMTAYTEALPFRRAKELEN